MRKILFYVMIVSGLLAITSLISGCKSTKHSEPALIKLSPVEYVE